jgi:hypothetical protein
MILFTRIGVCVLCKINIPLVAYSSYVSHREEKIDSDTQQFLQSPEQHFQWPLLKKGIPAFDSYFIFQLSNLHELNHFKLSF